MKKLKDLVEIFSGQSFRERIENDSEGNLYVIQMKDLSDDYSSIIASPISIRSNDISGKQILRKGDVLFLAKGTNNFALVFDKSYNAIATSIFFVLRLNSNQIDPYFLAWYINQENAQAYLYTGKEGSGVTNINKATLENLEVEIIPLEKQQHLLTVHELWKHEKEISLALLEKKDKLIQQQLISMFNGKV